MWVTRVTRKKLTLSKSTYQNQETGKLIFKNLIKITGITSHWLIGPNRP